MLQSQMAEESAALRSEYDTALSTKLDALQSAHEESSPIVYVPVAQFRHGVLAS